MVVAYSSFKSFVMIVEGVCCKETCEFKTSKEGEDLNRGSLLGGGEVPQRCVSLIDAINCALSWDTETGIGQHKITNILIQGESAGSLAYANDHNTAAQNLVVSQERLYCPTIRTSSSSSYLLPNHISRGEDRKSARHVFIVNELWLLSVQFLFSCEAHTLVILKLRYGRKPKHGGAHLEPYRQYPAASISDPGCTCNALNLKSKRAHHKHSCSVIIKLCILFASRHQAIGICM